MEYTNANKKWAEGFSKGASGGDAVKKIKDTFSGLLGGSSNDTQLAALKKRKEGNSGQGSGY